MWPITLVQGLLNKVQSLGLTNGAEEDLTVKLDRGLKSLQMDDDTDGATTHLTSFRNKIERWFDKGEITASTRDELLADVDLILLGFTLTDGVI
mgnify:CR=1 FL=1